MLCFAVAFGQGSYGHGHIHQTWCILATKKLLPGNKEGAE